MFCYIIPCIIVFTLECIDCVFYLKICGYIDAREEGIVGGLAKLHNWIIKDMKKKLLVLCNLNRLAHFFWHSSYAIIPAINIILYELWHAEADPGNGEIGGSENDSSKNNFPLGNKFTLISSMPSVSSTKL